MKYNDFTSGILGFLASGGTHRTQQMDIFKDRFILTVLTSNEETLYMAKAIKKEDDKISIKELKNKNMVKVKRITPMEFIYGITEAGSKLEDGEHFTHREYNKEYHYLVDFIINSLLDCKYDYHARIDTKRNYFWSFIYDEYNRRKIESIYIIKNKDGSVKIIRDIKMEDGWVASVPITKKELENIINSIK